MERLVKRRSEERKGMGRENALVGNGPGENRQTGSRGVSQALRRLAAFVLALLCLPVAAFAAQSFDLESMTIEELFALRDSVDAAIDKAAAEYAPVADYDEYVRNSVLHTGDKIRFSGTVLQVFEEEQSTIYYIALDQSAEDVFYVRDWQETDRGGFLKGDAVTVMGVSNGLIQYDGAGGEAITLPYATAEKVFGESAQMVIGDSNFAATRENPVPLGATARYDGSSFFNNSVMDITVTRVIRGFEAWKMVKTFDRNNAAPGPDQEYVIVYIETLVVESLDGQAAHVNDYDFTFVSASGVEYESAYVAGVEPVLQNLYKGAKCEGLIVGLVKKDDTPLLVYLAQSDAPLWFDLAASVPDAAQ